MTVKTPPLQYAARVAMASLFLAMSGATHAAEAIEDFAPLLADVNSAAENEGNELILPRIAASTETDEFGQATGYNFAFRLFRPATATRAAKKIGDSKTLFLGRPNPPDCGTIEYDRSVSETWKFLSQGKYLVAGVSMKSECYGSEGKKAHYNAHIYIASGELPGDGGGSKLTYYDTRLAALNLAADQNAAGSTQDLMITLIDDDTGAVQVLLRDFNTGRIYSKNKSTLAN